MPHIIKEQHLEDLCGNCKKPHGNQIEVLYQHHKIYEIITCIHCEYEAVRIKPDQHIDRSAFGR